MVKVGDIITIKSARFGDQKAKIIGGEAKRAKRWKLEIVDSGKVRYVDKDKLSEQTSQPDFTPDKKKTVVKNKKPKPASMLQTLDLSSMPTVNQQVDELTETLQAVSIKDEEEKNKLVKEVTQPLSILEDSQSKEDKPYMYRGIMYTAKWDKDDEVWYLEDKEDMSVAYIENGKVYPLEGVDYRPELYSPRERPKPKPKELTREEKNKIEAKKQEAMTDRERQVYLAVEKTPEVAEEIRERFEDQVGSMISWKNRINKLIDKFGKPPEGKTPEKEPKINMSSYKKFDILAVTEARMYDKEYLSGNISHHGYKLVEGEAVKKVTEERERLYKRYLEIEKMYAPMDPELRRKYGITDPAEEAESKEAEEYYIDGDEYMKVWDDEEGQWFIVNPETGEAIGFLDSSGELQRF
jgi:hypothetical protein